MKRHNWHSFGLWMEEERAAPTLIRPRVTGGVGEIEPPVRKKPRKDMEEDEVSQVDDESEEVLYH